MIRLTGKLTEAEKDVIRARRRAGMTLEAIGRIHDVTRERVRQVVLQAPNEEKRRAEAELGMDVYVEPDAPPPPEPDIVVTRPVEFRNKKHQHLEDVALQQAICNEAPNYRAIALKYGLSWALVEKIRRGQRCGKVYKRYVGQVERLDQPTKDAVRKDRLTMTGHALAAKYKLHVRAIYSVLNEEPKVLIGHLLQKKGARI